MWMMKQHRRVFQAKFRDHEGKECICALKEVQAEFEKNGVCVSFPLPLTDKPCVFHHEHNADSDHDDPRDEDSAGAAAPECGASAGHCGEAERGGGGGAARLRRRSTW